MLKILATYPTSIFTQPFLLILPLHLPPQRRRLSPRLISKLRGRRRLYRLPQSALEIDTHVYSGDHLPIGQTNGRVNYLTRRGYRLQTDRQDGLSAILLCSLENSICSRIARRSRSRRVTSHPGDAKNGVRGSRRRSLSPLRRANLQQNVVSGLARHRRLKRQ